MKLPGHRLALFFAAALIGPALVSLNLARAAEATAPRAAEAGGATPRQWSERMAKSEMARGGPVLAYGGRRTSQWEYTNGLFGFSLEQLTVATEDESYRKFAENFVTSFIAPDGSIRGCNPEEYNIDLIPPGRVVLAMLERGAKKDRLLKAAKLLRGQLAKHPRTSDGGFWHKQRYPCQMWLDGVYMGSPFYAQYAKIFREPASTDDDCIAIKSGRNNDGRRVNEPSENIIVRGCTMKDGHGGVVIGSEISGSCRNVFVENCMMDCPNLERALRFKSNARRGGVLENVFMRNVTIGRVAEAVLTIDLVYEEGANGPEKPIVRNIVLGNVTSQASPRVMWIRGFPAATIDRIRFAECTFNGVEATEVLQGAGSVSFTNVSIEPAKPARGLSSRPPDGDNPSP